MCFPFLVYEKIEVRKNLLFKIETMTRNMKNEKNYFNDVGKFTDVIWSTGK